jgi:hypothetical protein
VANARARSPIRDPARNILGISSRIITPPGRTAAPGLVLFFDAVVLVPVAKNGEGHKEHASRRIVCQPADGVNP